MKRKEFSFSAENFSSAENDYRGSCILSYHVYFLIINHKMVNRKVTQQYNMPLPLFFKQFIGHNNQFSVSIVQKTDAIMRNATWTQTLNVTTPVAPLFSISYSVLLA